MAPEVLPLPRLRLFRCQVKLNAEMPGQQHHRRRRVRASALRESEELGGDPQRADGGTTGGETSWWFDKVFTGKVSFLISHFSKTIGNHFLMGNFLGADCWYLCWWFRQWVELLEFGDQVSLDGLGACWLTGCVVDTLWNLAFRNCYD